MSPTMVLFLVAGGIISFFGVLSVIAPDKTWGLRRSPTLKRLLALLAVLIGATLMAQGFAHL